ncbi:restriction endonuclease subunit S [Micromonospora sp. AP08]|uniref:restriction endonuclease subunit S n=1 Tax=Micromonospora sp. AP08 TaxID=2604467 RepID=UPI0016527AE9|nr:restriction endonuclease subunit S [Micromonospora sp. AP08]
MADVVGLGDVAEIITGFPFKSALFTENLDDIRLLRGDNIGQGRLRWAGVKRWPNGDVQDLAAYRVRQGDVVLAMDRPWIEAGLKFAEVRREDVPSLLVQRVALLRAKQPLTQRFLAYLVGSPAFTNHVLAVQTGTAVPHISGRQIASFTFSLPSTRRQEAVAAVLGALDDKIAVNDRIAETVHKLAAAEYARVAQLAERACTLGDVIELTYGKALPAAQRRSGPVAVYGSGGISGWHDEPLVRGPGIIVGRKGTVGSVYWSHRDFFPIDTTYYIRVTDDQLTTEYVYFLLTRLGLSEMNSDSAVPGLNRSRALAIPVHLPNGEVIAEFTERIRPLFAMREQTARENQTLAKLRDTLLPELMSGRLRVKDAEKVVGEAV